MKFFNFIFRGMNKDYYEVWLENIVNKSKIKKPKDVSTSRFRKCFSTLVSWGFKGINTSVDKNKVLKYYKYIDFFNGINPKEMKKIQKTASTYRKKFLNSKNKKPRGKEKMSSEQVDDAEKEKKEIVSMEDYMMQLDDVVTKYNLNRAREFHLDYEKVSKKKASLETEKNEMEENIKKKYKLILEGKRYKDKEKEARAVIIKKRRVEIEKELKEADRSHKIEKNDYRKKNLNYINTSKEVMELFKKIASDFAETEKYEERISDALNVNNEELLFEIKDCMKKSGKNSFGNLKSVFEVIIHCIDKGRPVSINTGYKGIKPVDYGFRRSTWLSLLRRIAMKVGVKLTKCGKTSRKEVSTVSKQKPTNNKSQGFNFVRDKLRRACASAHNNMKNLSVQIIKTDPDLQKEITAILEEVEELSAIVDSSLLV